MSCPTVEELSALADRETGYEESRLLRSHLRGCPACSVAARSIAACGRAVRELAVPSMPESLRAELRRTAREVARKHERDARLARRRRKRRLLAGKIAREAFLRPAFGLAGAAGLSVVLAIVPGVFPPRVDVTSFWADAVRSSAVGRTSRRGGGDIPSVGVLKGILFRGDEPHGR